MSNSIIDPGFDYYGSPSIEAWYDISSEYNGWAIWDSINKNIRLLANVDSGRFGCGAIEQYQQLSSNTQYYVEWEVIEVSGVGSFRIRLGKNLSESDYYAKSVASMLVGVDSTIITTDDNPKNLINFSVMGPSPDVKIDNIVLRVLENPSSDENPSVVESYSSSSSSMESSSSSSSSMESSSSSSSSSSMESSSSSSSDYDASTGSGSGLEEFFGVSSVPEEDLNESMGKYSNIMHGMTDSDKGDFLANKVVSGEISADMAIAIAKNMGLDIDV